MLKPVVFIFLSIVYLSSCNTRPFDSHHSEAIPFGDSVRNYYNKDTAWINDIDGISQAANLDKLDSGYKGYQLRIWLGHSMAVWRNIVIIKYFEQKWTAELMIYKLIAHTRKMTTIKILDHKRVSPKSGWNALNNSVNDFGIISFVKSNKWLGDGGGDGISYDFELADNGDFFTSSYGNPEYDTVNIKQASNILGFSKMLENEFGFEYVK